MVGAYASLLILLAATLVVGQALAALASGATRERPIAFSWLAPGFGIAALLVGAGIAARLPGRALTAAIVLAVATLVALTYLRGRTTGLREAALLGVPVVVITSLAASLPFALAGNVGILGAGLVNDDMASHLIIADYVADPAGSVPSFVQGGYPIGPHAVVAALSEALGAGLVEVFAGFTVALAPLLGLVGLGLLEGVPRGRRIVGSCLVALPYLGAAYLVSGAFKEPLQALILIVFAVTLWALVEPGSRAEGERRPHPLRRVLPLLALAAASVFNYSLPGLLWIGAVAGAVLVVRLLLVEPRPRLPEGWLRRVAPYALGALVILALATAQEWSRIADFSRLSALNPDRFGSELGNLRQALSPLEALGVWPSGEYRLSPSGASLPAAVFYLGAAIGAAALVAGLVWSKRRARLELPAALAAVLAVWVVAALFSTPYIAAKALAIASPIVIAIALRGTLGANGPRLALGLLLVAAASLSSFLALRQAPVGPDGHADQLDQVRPVVADEEVLFLGRDDFIGWELRGSGPITGIVTNFYDVEDARPRFKKGEGGGEKFDVDAVFPKTLDSFRYILATTGGPASSPPPRFLPVVETNDYVLYERRGPTGRRKTLDEGTEPGAVLDCSEPEGREIASGQGTAVVWDTAPVIAGPDAWTPTADPSDGTPATQTLEIPEPGRWLISLAYDSRRPLRVSAPELGIETELVANLDFRGPTPYFPVAEVEVTEPVEAEVTVEPVEPNALAGLLRAPNEAHLRSLSATPLGVISRIQKRQSCGRYVDWYRAR